MRALIGLQQKEQWISRLQLFDDLYVLASVFNSPIIDASNYHACRYALTIRFRKKHA